MRWKEISHAETTNVTEYDALCLEVVWLRCVAHQGFNNTRGGGHARGGREPRGTSGVLGALCLGGEW